MAPVRDLTPGSDGVESGAEEIRDRHPADPVWRADALAASRHRRLTDEIPQPKDDFDEARAETLCGEICRDVLRDYAPGLALLDPADRRRVQALTAYARTLFDFARQRGLEGERLAQINRWEFTLESALSGQPVGQPVFVAMARCERQRPWPREALDELAAVARSSVIRGETQAWGEAQDQRLASALVGALDLGSRPGTPAVRVIADGIARRRRQESPRGNADVASTSPPRLSTSPPTQPFWVGDGTSAPATANSRSPLASDPAPGGRIPSSLPSSGGRVDTAALEEGSTKPGLARFIRFVELVNAGLDSRQSLGVWRRLVFLARARATRPR